MLGDLGTYVDLAKRVKDPQAAERLTPEIIAALVTGVADSRTKSDRGQAGILGSRQARDAADALTGMTQEDYAKTMTLLLGTEIADPGRDTAKADPAVERALLLKAVAARRDDYHVSILERIRMMGIPVPGHGTMMVVGKLIQPHALHRLRKSSRLKQIRFMHKN